MFNQHPFGSMSPFAEPSTSIFRNWRITSVDIQAEGETVQSLVMLEDVHSFIKMGMGKSVENYGKWLKKLNSVHMLQQKDHLYITKKTLLLIVQNSRDRPVTDKARYLFVPDYVAVEIIRGYVGREPRDRENTGADLLWEYDKSRAREERRHAQNGRARPLQKTTVPSYEGEQGPQPVVDVNRIPTHKPLVSIQLIGPSGGRQLVRIGGSIVHFLAYMSDNGSMYVAIPDIVSAFKKYNASVDGQRISDVLTDADPLSRSRESKTGRMLLRADLVAETCKLINGGV